MNGAFGVDFSSLDLTDEQVQLVSERLPIYGVTSFFPTIISSTPDLYKRNTPLIGQCKSKKSKIKGLHLEGPLFQPSQRGAHALENIVSEIDEQKSDQALEKIYGNNNLQQYVSLVTLAPELPGVTSVIKLLVEKYGIVVSMGHTNSTVEQGEEAIDNGATCLTHLFNAMTPIHHRRPGIIGLLCSQPQIKYGIIADGIHVHPTAIKMAFQMNPNGLLLVTDAMAGLGMKNGSQTFLGNQKITVNDGKAILTGTKGTLAGSIISMDACVQNIYKFTDCSKAQAIAAATYSPAQLLPECCNNIGQIKAGYLADLVLLDFENLKLRATWLEGIRYSL